MACLNDGLQTPVTLVLTDGMIDLMLTNGVAFPLRDQVVQNGTTHKCMTVYSHDGDYLCHIPQHLINSKISVRRSRGQSIGFIRDDCPTQPGITWAWNGDW